MEQNLIKANLVPLTTVHFACREDFIPNLIDISQLVSSFDKEKANNLVSKWLANQPYKQECPKFTSTSYDMTSNSAADSSSRTSKGSVPKWFKPGK
ncbi:hypothetical protein Ciccas_003885 [Cichlidogyrus casuarinus]|uniref:Uncharacterized protein n=1 Tax=Cichlidogyrus casuarinus TaxID=1844966 RepID=A0ABD2QGE9_9PLAT